MSTSPPTSIRPAPASGNCPDLARAKRASACAISRAERCSGRRRNSFNDRSEGCVMLLEGKTVVVVGGSSGIGLATAELARQEGAEVVIAARSKDRLTPAADRIGARAIVADVTDDDSVAALFRTCGVVDHVAVTAAQLHT